MSEQKIPIADIVRVYRPDIDGLRAIAVMAVIFYHYFPGLVPGGFIGVDVFFVISGYLISSLIISELNNNSFSFKDFYQSRARRIFPALIVVLFLSVAFGWLTLLEAEFYLLGKHIYASSFFIQNIVLWSEVGYFDVSSNLKPLLHIWSLSLEEQFYIAYPILLWLGWRKSKLVTQILVLILAVLSFVTNVWGVGRYGSASFFLLPARTWEFLLGCMLILIPVYRDGLAGQFRIWPKLMTVGQKVFSGNVFAYIGLFMLLIGSFYLNGKDQYPGWRALLPCLATLLLIEAGSKSFVGESIGGRIFVFIGLISYPLYLWHWPLLAFARIILYPNEPTFYFKCTLLLLCMLLAWATFVYVESPVRFNKLKKTPRTIVASLLLIAVAIIGLMVANKIIISRIGYEKANITLAQSDWSYPDDAGKQSNRVMLETRTIKGDNTKSMILIGDSHVKQYWSRFEYLNKTDASLGSVTFAPSVCPPLPNIVRISEEGDCQKMFEEAMKLAGNVNIKHVIFGAYWEAYLIGHFGYNEKNFISDIADSRDLQKLPLKFDSEKVDNVFEEFKRNISQLILQGKKVTIILSNPTGPAYEPGRMIGSRIPLFMDVLKNDHFIYKGDFIAFVSPVMNKLRLIASQTGAEIVDPVDFLCGVEKCYSTLAGDPIYMDGNHLRSTYVRDHANFLDGLYVK